MDRADSGSCPVVDFDSREIEPLGCLSHFVVMNIATVLFISTLLTPTNCTFS
jgi:hypothetical protein